MIEYYNFEMGVYAPILAIMVCNMRRFWPSNLTLIRLYPASKSNFNLLHQRKWASARYVDMWTHAPARFTLFGSAAKIIVSIFGSLLAGSAGIS